MRTRFAPSPSGPLHVGHYYAAFEACRLARELAGECLLRIEDIDARCKPQWVELMRADFEWLGLHFEGETLVQSQRMSIYAGYLEQLKARGLLYPCFCTRAQMQQQMQESGRAPHHSLGYQYEGQCRQLSPDLAAQWIAQGRPHAWRLNMQRAHEICGALEWEDLYHGKQYSRAADWGDVVLARKEIPASYHLCVVVDDALQGISHVTRGLDLFEATHIHRVLQALLGFEPPLYAHHALLCDEQGKRLAKRDGARSIASLREAGLSAEQLRETMQRALQQGGIWQML